MWRLGSVESEAFCYNEFINIKYYKRQEMAHTALVPVVVRQLHNESPFVVTMRHVQSSNGNQFLTYIIWIALHFINLSF